MLHFLVYRYVFDGPLVLLTEKKNKNEDNVFKDDKVNIFIVQQEKTFEASNANWKMFEEHFKDVGISTIFPQSLY